MTSEHTASGREHHLDLFPTPYPRMFLAFQIKSCTFTGTLVPSIHFLNINDPSNYLSITLFDDTEGILKLQLEIQVIGETVVEMYNYPNTSTEFCSGGYNDMWMQFATGKLIIGAGHYYRTDRVIGEYTFGNEIPTFDNYPKIFVQSGSFKIYTGNYWKNYAIKIKFLEMII